jgi:hypothetical protein
MKARSMLFIVFVFFQATILISAGIATLWWSSELMRFLIYLVGEERALGAKNVIHLEGGRKLLTNPGAMFLWVLPLFLLGFVQITSALTLGYLWFRRTK